MANGKVEKRGEEKKEVERKEVEKKAEEKKAEVKTAEEKKTAEVKTAEKTVKEIVGTIEEKLKSAIKTIDVEDLKAKVEELEKIDEEIERLKDRKVELMDSIITVMETVDIELFKTLKALGINGITDTILKASEYVRKAMKELNAEVEEEKPKRVTVRTRRGEGIGNRKINFKGRVYNIPQYFLKKHGIVGGLQGLKEWAEENGYKVEITDDMIIIS